MKIIYIGSAYPLRGGLSTFNERLATILQDAGQDVTLYTFSLQYPSFLFPGKTQYSTDPPPAHLKIRVMINSINPLTWLKTGRAIRREKPDMILLKFWLPFMGPAFGTILKLANKGHHTRVICIVDNAIPHEKRPGDKAFTQYFFRQVDAFLSMSKGVLSDLRTLTTKPAIYSPHPLYDNYGEAVSKAAACEKLGLDVTKKYLLFFGFIRGYKGLSLLLQAMNDARIREAGIRLIVAGEFYEDHKPYDEEIAQLGIAGALHLFTDFIPESEVRYFFSAADLVVQPYRSATQSGITQIAYHFNKPMVVTNVGSLPEAVPHGKVGYVAEPEPAAIADAILKFFAPDALPQLQQHLAEEKKKYSWETFVGKLMELYGQVKA